MTFSITDKALEQYLNGEPEGLEAITDFAFHLYQYTGSPAMKRIFTIIINKELAGTSEYMNCPDETDLLDSFVLKCIDLSKSKKAQKRLNELFLKGAHRP